MAATKTANINATIPAFYEVNSSQFDNMIATGISQAKEDDSFDLDEVFSELEHGLV